MKKSKGSSPATAPRNGLTFTLRWRDRSQRDRAEKASTRARWSMNTFILEAIERAVHQEVKDAL